MAADSDSESASPLRSVNSSPRRSGRGRQADPKIKFTLPRGRPRRSRAPGATRLSSLGRSLGWRGLPVGEGPARCCRGLPQAGFASESGTQSRFRSLRASGWARRQPPNGPGPRRRRRGHRAPRHGGPFALRLPVTPGGSLERTWRPPALTRTWTRNLTHRDWKHRRCQRDYESGTRRSSIP